MENVSYSFGSLVAVISGKLTKNFPTTENKEVMWYNVGFWSCWSIEPTDDASAADAFDDGAAVTDIPVDVFDTDGGDAAGIFDTREWHNDI